MAEEKQEQGKKGPAGTHSICSDLLSAEAVLEKVSKEMANEYEKHGKNWPRDWMKKHATERDIIIKARNILLDRTGR